jgi:hypothetical protein
MKKIFIPFTDSSVMSKGLADMPADITPDKFFLFCQVRDADIHERAERTVFSALCFGRCPIPENGVHLIGKSDNMALQFIRDLQVLPPADLIVIEIRLIDPDPEHLFEAHGLCAKLDFIALIDLRLATLVLDWLHQPPAFMIWNRDTGIRPGVFDHISDPGQTERVRDKGKCSGDDNISPGLIEERIINPLMNEAPFLRAEILLPLLLDMDQCPLPPAETKMLDTGQREQFVIRIAIPAHNFSMISTPFGTSLATVTL